MKNESQEVPEWEKEFDNEFPNWKRQALSWEKTAEEMKLFIIRVRNQALEEAAEALKKSIIDKIHSVGGIGGMTHLREIISDATVDTIRSLKQ